MRRSSRWAGTDGDSLTRLVVRFLIDAVAVWVASHIVPGITPLNTLSAIALVAVILGVLNALVKPLFELITCPIEILTLGLFTLVINAAMLGLTSWIAQRISVPFRVDGFVPALMGAIVIGVVSWVLSRFV